MEEETFDVTIDPDLEDLIPGYLEGRHRDVESITRGLAENDLETIRVLGHSMKGSGGGYGFDGITELGRDLEAAAGAGERDRIGSLLEELKGYLKRVRIVYG